MTAIVGRADWTVPWDEPGPAQLQLMTRRPQTDIIFWGPRYDALGMQNYFSRSPMRRNADLTFPFVHFVLLCFMFFKMYMFLSVGDSC